MKTRYNRQQKVNPKNSFGYAERLTKDLFIVKSIKSERIVIDMNSHQTYNMSNLVETIMIQEDVKDISFKKKLTESILKKHQYEEGGAKGAMGESIAIIDKFRMTNNLNNPFWYSCDKAEVNQELVKLIRQLINTMFMHNERDGKYVGWWFANQIIRPCEKVMTCLILNGDGGTGKTTLVELVCIAINKNDEDETAKRLDSSDDLMERFWKSNIVGSTFIYVDEVDTNSKKVTNNIKAITTANSILYEKKGEDFATSAYYGDIVLLSNRDKPIPLEGTNRKFAIATPRKIMVANPVSASDSVNAEICVKINDLIAEMTKEDAAISIKTAFEIYLDEDGEFKAKKEYVNDVKNNIEKILNIDPLADAKEVVKGLAENHKVFCFEMIAEEYALKYNQYDDMYKIYLMKSNKRQELAQQLGFTCIVKRDDKVYNPEVKEAMKEHFGLNQPTVYTVNKEVIKEFSKGKVSKDAWRSRLLLELDGFGKEVESIDENETF